MRPEAWSRASSPGPPVHKTKGGKVDAAYQYQPNPTLQAEAEKAQAGREYVIRCQRIGDDYRGDLDCIKIITPVERGPIRAIDGGAAEEEVIYIDSVPVATFVTWYGSGGSSWKRAAQVIRPLGKTRIEWEWPED